MILKESSDKVNFKPLWRVCAQGLILTVLIGTSLWAQTDWPTYGNDAGNTRHSTLKQINTQNVSKLTRAWTYHLTAPVVAPAGGGRGNAVPAAELESAQPARPAAAGVPPAGPVAGRGGGGRGRSSEATPIVVNGVLYMPTPYSRVVALEPETGKELWVYQLPNGANPSARGVAYWPGDGQSPASIVFGTTDGRLVSLNAATGKPNPGFGNEGSVDMKQGITNGFPNGNFSLSSPAMVFENLVITGARVQENPSFGFAGDTRAWDLRTGKLVWQFHSVPQAGETGNETWEGDSWKNRSGTNVWGILSLDRQLGMVYLPHGSPTYDFYGADRPGANLFGNSLVALDARTGKLKWYYQMIHHDTWDYDAESAAILFDVTRNGTKIPALSITNKTGLVFILDRRDGKPIYGVEERKVPETDVPGEKAWPTEPFPLKPPPLSRMSFKPEEIAKVTPEHQKACEDLLASDGGLHNDGPFTRYGSKMSIVFPGTWGGSNWHGGSYDPDLGYLFYNTANFADIGKVIKATEGSRTPYFRTGPTGTYSRFWNTANSWPCQEPPWGELTAINVNTGDVAWKIPFGTVPELEAKGLKNTGALNLGGSVTTAGGLLFIGATGDRHFRAFESKTGKTLWDVQLEAGAYSSPLTYQGKDGKQYVVVVAAGSAYMDRQSGDSVIAFALP